MEIISIPEGLKSTVITRNEFCIMYWLAKLPGQKNKFIEHLGDGISEDETFIDDDNHKITLTKVLRILDRNKFANYIFTCVFISPQSDMVLKKTVMLLYNRR
ncbi:soluble IL-18-binding protein [NY_014 poxvirus]|uniref:soluble IL-18-binding protein n=1 Tax=NY_014 poxvirus TaxID=2025360 RepID=UPI000B99FBAB|nr:soluble IL-18-binding protein [NY_014 poxvirus]AST09415.1 soluble IL-18-binding protein [NY_014 poxvirus]